VSSCKTRKPRKMTEKQIIAAGVERYGAPEPWRSEILRECSRGGRYSSTRVAAAVLAESNYSAKLHPQKPTARRYAKALAVAVPPYPPKPHRLIHRRQYRRQPHRLDLRVSEPLFKENHLAYNSTSPSNKRSAANDRRERAQLQQHSRSRGRCARLRRHRPHHEWLAPGRPEWHDRTAPDEFPRERFRRLFRNDVLRYDGWRVAHLRRRCMAIARGWRVTLNPTRRLPRGVGIFHFHLKEPHAYGSPSRSDARP
jgi:hypothetical protein